MVTVLEQESIVYLMFSLCVVTQTKNTEIKARSNFYSIYLNKNIC